MLNGIKSLIGMSVLLLAVGYMAGYIYGNVYVSTYNAISRGVSAFWLASGALFITGIVYRATFNRLSSVCGILLCVSLAVALLLTGFHYAVDSSVWRR